MGHIPIEMNIFITVFDHMLSWMYAANSFENLLRIWAIVVQKSKEPFSNITGTCILHSKAILDDHWSPWPFLWKHLVFSSFLLSSSFPLSVQVCFLQQARTGTPHFHQRMGQKLAVSTFPTHGLQQNMACNCWRKPKRKKHKGTS